MPRNNYQKTPARRCIALTKSGSQCKNTINCYHHRCHDRACTQGTHTSEEHELTPLSIRQEYLTPAWSCTTSKSGSPNDNGQRDTGRVPPSPHEMPNQNNTHRQSPLFPDESSRISEINEEYDDGQEQLSGPGHAQPSLEVHARGSSVQPPSIKTEDTRIWHEEYDIAGPSRAREPIQRSDQPFRGLDTPLLDSVIDDRMFTSPMFDSTPPDLNPESGVTAKGKEKERSETQTDITDEKRHDSESIDWADFFTLSTPTRSTQPPTRSSQPPTRSSQPPTRTSQPPTRPSQPPTQSSQPPTQSSPSNPNQSRNSTLEMIHPDDTARQSLTPSSYYSEPREPGEPYSFTTSPMSRFQSASIRDPDHVSSPAPYWTRSADTDHGISPEELAIQDQNARVRARRANRGLANSSI